MAKRFCGFMVYGLWFIAVCVGLWGCSSGRSVVSEEVSSDVARTHDTVYVARTLVDRIVERDTVQTFVRGDSVFREVIRWRVRDRVKTDAVYQSRTDTVAVIRERRVEKTVEREPGAWERVRMWCFWPLVGAVCAGAAWTWWRRRKSGLQ